MVLQLGGKEAQDIQVELVKHGCGASLVINTVLSGVTNKDASLLLLTNFRRSTFY
jgi:hypothetical protein